MVIELIYGTITGYYGNLARRTLCEEAVCPLCKADLENSEHSFVVL